MLQKKNHFSCFSLCLNSIIQRGGDGFNVKGEVWVNVTQLHNPVDELCYPQSAMSLIEVIPTKVSIRSAAYLTTKPNRIN